MVERPAGWAAVALRKALFSADRIIEVSMEVYNDHLLTLQFF
jgi:hypothetical protein